MLAVLLSLEGCHGNLLAGKTRPLTTLSFLTEAATEEDKRVGRKGEREEEDQGWEVG